MRTHIIAAFGLLLSGVLGAAACAPSPKSVPCANDAECAKLDEGYAYCLESRCVECVGRGSCGGHPCVDGVCQIPCKNGCDADRHCVDELCVKKE